MRNSMVALLLSLVLASQGFAQNKSQSTCSRYDDRTKITSDNYGATYYIEVCKVPNQEGKPALSIVFSSTPEGADAMRIYSQVAGKPLNLDGIYVERNGEKQFILHRTEVEWANGSATNLNSVDPKKKRKLDAVFAAALELLKGAEQNHRIPSRNSQDHANLMLVFNFMFDYQLNGKH